MPTGRIGISGGGGLKRVQSGKVAVTNVETTKNVTITPALTNIKNAIVRIQSAAPGTLVGYDAYRVELLNTTTIQAVRGTSAVGAFTYQVEEYYNVKQRLSANVSLTAGVTNITIPSVDPTKCLVYVSNYMLGGSGYYGYEKINYEITSATNLALECTIGTLYANYQILEFY